MLSTSDLYIKSHIPGFLMYFTLNRYLNEYIVNCSTNYKVFLLFFSQCHLIPLFPFLLPICKILLIQNTSSHIYTLLFVSTIPSLERFLLPWKEKQSAGAYGSSSFYVGISSKTPSESVDTWNCKEHIKIFMLCFSHTYIPIIKFNL